MVFNILLVLLLHMSSKPKLKNCLNTGGIQMFELYNDILCITNWAIYDVKTARPCEDDTLQQNDPFGFRSVYLLPCHNFNREKRICVSSLSFNIPGAPTQPDTILTPTASNTNDLPNDSNLIYNFQITFYVCICF